MDNYICLSHLILSHNELNSLYGLEKCKQLWRIEVNNNKVKQFELLLLLLLFENYNILFVIMKA